MILCGVHAISKMYGGNILFENISLEIHEGDRIGLVGRNGTGKTTLFKLIAKQYHPDIGYISLQKGAQIGYLAQIPTYPTNMTGLEVLETAFSELKEMERQMKAVEQEMSNNPENIDHMLQNYGQMQEQYTIRGGYGIEASIARVTNGLNIQDLLDKSFHSLSGGEQTKICLALILLKEPDLLLLDEPTNHLDVHAVEWLEEFLRDYKGTVVLISHDRYFIDEVATKIMDLEDGEIHVYHTNYTKYVQEKEEKLMHEFHHYQEQQKKIKKMKETIKKLREWASQANPPSEKLFRRAKSMEKALERMEKLKKPIIDAKKIDLKFQQKDRSGKDVVVLENVAKSFGDRLLFHEADMLVQYGERTAIVGGNGSGKSTIIKMLLDEEQPTTGKVRLGSSVKVGYLSQHSNFDSDRKLIDVFREEVPVTEGEARHILARFLFYGPAVFRKVSGLSGGEKMRLRLAQLMYQDLNLLLLDEPTNHLDIESREVLEEALENFPGTILAVSHDRYFLNKLFQRTYWIEDRKLYQFAGPYSWARTKLAVVRPREEESKAVKLSESTVVKSENKEKTSTKQIEEIEQELLEMETAITQLENQMTTLTDVQLLQSLHEEKQEKEKHRDALYQQWERLL
ncbi:ribosomal protection-like ABC-F family protein [Bacillus sp. 2205SS5-2]|uniref:ribosomal protection-like ABC-F family protein n=1 Tax=Bacillus sp. 2205SS5-2 TaxID=3109031 RepID=UPI003006680B